MSTMTTSCLSTRRCRPVCRHEPRCPAADSAGHAAARTVASYPVQGWRLLCNGVVVFDDTGELLPDGVSVAPQRPVRYAAREP
jgi:Family of unknown function (DUF5999)